MARVLQEGNVVLRLFNYPAWTAEVNGKPVATETTEVTGQMSIPVKPGDNHIEVRFMRTWDRTAGGVISIVTALGIFGFVMIRRGTRAPQLQRLAERRTIYPHRDRRNALQPLRSL